MKPSQQEVNRRIRSMPTRVLVCGGMRVSWALCGRGYWHAAGWDVMYQRCHALWRKPLYRVLTAKEGYSRPAGGWPQKTVLPLVTAQEQDRLVQRLILPLWQDLLLYSKLEAKNDEVRMSLECAYWQLPFPQDSSFPKMKICNHLLDLLSSVQTCMNTKDILKNADNQTMAVPIPLYLFCVHKIEVNKYHSCSVTDILQKKISFWFLKKKQSYRFEMKKG